MFTEIIKAISEKEYETAQTALLPLSQGDNAETAAKADYLLGYINTRYDYPQRKAPLARRYLRNNLNSDFPQPLASVLYAKVETDSNIAINYLNKGLVSFPNTPEIYVELMRLVPDKECVINRIDNSGLTNPHLLGCVVNHLISSNQWSQISPYVFRIQNNNSLQEYEEMYLNLINAYAYLFGEETDYSKARSILEEVISKDIDNLFSYAHYIGVIYALIKLGDLTQATKYFDRLPVNNSICDLDDGPQPLDIYINFEQVYQVAFQTISEAFAQDAVRKTKANVLYVLYLFYPSLMCDIHRYKKSDALLLTRYVKSNFNANVAAALFNMRCHFNQYMDAYDAYWQFLRHYEDPERCDVYISQILDNVSGAELTAIADLTVKYLQEDEFESSRYISYVFSPLVRKLHEDKQYANIPAIADYSSIEQILLSKCAFECAYAYANTENERAVALYEGIVAKDPANSSAINNLGVRYENKGELYKALDCYEKACGLNPTENLYLNNLRRIQSLITQQRKENLCNVAKRLTITGYEEIGYSVPLCQKILTITDKDMRDILFRDLRECAIAVVAGQDKMATIMCGSIIEAILMNKIMEHGITRYDISEISGKNGASNAVVSTMGLNELLYVAGKEKILNTNSYHLGHYIRDYRNVVHPAKEIRMKEEVTHENVLTMWSVLLRIITELFSK